MKIHTKGFKENIAKFGRELDSKITFTISGTTTELGNEQLNSVSPHYEGAILKSVMKQLDIDSNVEIPVGTEVNYQFGIKVGNNYEYMNYGNYIVKDIEKQEDTRSWKITCYDKMLYAMKDYDNTGITFPLTIRDYISVLCTKLGLTFKNASDTFANYDKVISKELYIGDDGNSLGYTFRDVFDELSEATASTICINEDDDELEIRYIQETKGKNLFKTAQTQTLNGITLTKNSDGSITLNGTASANTEFIGILDTPLSANTYTLSYTANKTISNSQVQLLTRTSDNARLMYIHAYNLSGKITSTITSETSKTNIFIYNGVTLSNYRIYIQLEQGSTATDYEPYGDTIDEEYLKDVNVNFADKVGPINTIILSRSGGSDKVALSNPANLADEDKIPLTITDNQIMNDNNRADYLQDILNKLYGLEYYINDYTSTGVCYYNVCDLYNVKIGENLYPCIMLNDEVNITQGLVETVYTEELEGSEQDYKHISNDDRMIDQAYIIVKKNEGTIESLVKRVGDVEVKEGNDYKELLQKFKPVDDALVTITDLETSVRTLQTDTYTKTEVQQIANGTGVNGVKVSAVINTSGTFDENGMTYEKTGAHTKTTINQIGINTKDQNDSSVLFAGYVDTATAPQDILTKYNGYENQTIVGTDNIIVNNYLNIGAHSRIQNYGNGTGIFWR